MTIGIGRSSRICRAASIPSSRRHLHVQQRDIGLRLSREPDRLLPVPASAQTSKPTLSSRPLRSSRMIVSSSATRTRNGSVTGRSRARGTPCRASAVRAHASPVNGEPHDAICSSVVRSLSCSLKTPTMSRSQQPSSRSTSSRLRPTGNVLEAGANVRERARRLPRQGVPDEDRVGPARKSRCAREPRARVRSRARTARRRSRPASEALQQIAVRAAHVEEGTVAVDRIRDEASRPLPVVRRPGLARLSPRGLRSEVRRDDERLGGLVPRGLVDLAAIEPGVDLGQLLARSCP